MKCNFQVCTVITIGQHKPAGRLETEKAICSLPLRFHIMITVLTRVSLSILQLFAFPKSKQYKQLPKITR